MEKVTMDELELDNLLHNEHLNGYNDALFDIAMYFRDLKDGCKKFTPNHKAYAGYDSVKDSIATFHIELGEFLKWAKIKGGPNES